MKKHTENHHTVTGPDAMSTARHSPSAQAEALQARFALKVTARLDGAVTGVPHDIAERLRIARAQAVAGARLATQPAAAPVGVETAIFSPALAGASAAGTPAGGFQWRHDHGRAADHGRKLDDSPLSWGWRLAGLLPVLALVVGLYGVSVWKEQAEVQAAAEVDTALLTDDLPPEAYRDPGFEEFLKSELPARDTTSAMADDSLEDPDLPALTEDSIELKSAVPGEESAKQ